MNKSKTLYASFLPVIILVLLVLGTGYYMTKGDFELFDTDNKLEVRRLEGFPKVLDITNENLEKQRLVIKSQQELDSFLMEMDPSGQTKLRESINFDKEYIIAASTETNTRGGYALKIKKIYDKLEDKEGLLVSIEETSPDDDCITTQVLNVAFDMVAIDKTDEMIDFEKVKKIETCE